MSTQRYLKNPDGGNFTPIFHCHQCIWGYEEEGKPRMCTAHDKPIIDAELKDGFPEFCELPDSVALLKNRKPIKDGLKVLTHVCNLLNEALFLDPLAVDNLITLHVVCNNLLAEHPTIQVRQTFGQRHTTSMLGLLNGLTDGKHYLIARYDDKGGELTRFDVIESNMLEELSSASDAEEKLDRK